MKPVLKQCAVYTRKSTEDGLEQEFNSLDAQREACLAYITSQKSEGWVPVKEHYDDGGYSGGNIERPGLKRLMEDIKAGKIQTVVVYKIDRLTRSLTDFSKLVDVFDKHGVTFVSVTQSFNTTTSMGRLTLNVLLSFAQFEREVTGERIRDKVAASKRKGMWMGGCAPLGYDVIDKRLEVNKAEAETVRLIFETYLQLGCVARLKAELDERKILSKSRTSRKERTSGGALFSRGALYHLLRNPVFIGKTKHGSNIYDGQHIPILSNELWEQAQERLKRQAALPRGAKKRVSTGYLLKGKLFDNAGNFYSPAHSNKNGKRYCYYVSQAMLQYRDHPKGVLARLPATEIDNLVRTALRPQLVNLLDFTEKEDLTRRYVEENIKTFANELISQTLSRVIVTGDTLKLEIDVPGLREMVVARLDIVLPTDTRANSVTLSVPFYTRRVRDGAIVVEPGPSKTDGAHTNLDPEELKNLVLGTIWRDEHFDGMSVSSIARRERVSDTFAGKLIHNSFSGSCGL